MTHNILLIGGHGKVAQLLTPLLLAKSWNVTSMIRAPEQRETIEKLGKNLPGKLSVLVSSVEEVKSEGDARRVLDHVGVGVDWVVWSAGAGGRGGPTRTKAIDHDAAIAFTRAAIASPSIKKFLTISYNTSRRNKAPWYTDADWEAARHVNEKVLPAYYEAKVAADEVLSVLARERNEKEEREGVAQGERFCGVSLRPGRLTDEDGNGGVSMGKIGAMGSVARKTVARAVVAVLETEGARGWFDVLDGEEDVRDAVRRCVRDKVDCVEGENLEDMRERVGKLL